MTREPVSLRDFLEAEGEELFPAGGRWGHAEEIIRADSWSSSSGLPEAGTVREATKEEFLAAGAPVPARPIAQEKAWLEHEGLWAAIMFDHDGEWCAVCLAPGPEGGKLGAVDLKVNAGTRERATAWAKEALERHAKAGVRHEGAPVTEREAASILSAATGIPVEDVEAGMDDVRIPRPENN